MDTVYVLLLVYLGRKESNRVGDQNYFDNCIISIFLMEWAYIFSGEKLVSNILIVHITLY